MSGLKTLTWRTLSVAALLLSTNIASAEFLFGNSDESGTNGVNRLTLDGTVELYSGANQGWWSATWASTNPEKANYLVGSFEDSLPGGDPELQYFNNFFIFDISALTTQITSAVLNLQFYKPYTPSGASSLTYGLFDVSTDLDLLNTKLGTNASIFDDLGSGTNYGKFVIPTSLSQTDVVSLTLNSAGVADLNKAIESGATKFAIGGTLLAPEPVGRSVPDSTSTFALFGAAAASLWALRRKQSA